MKKAIEVKNISIFFRNVDKFSIKKLYLEKDHNEDSFVALDNVSFTIEKGKVYGILGRNGSGKTTLLKTISGILCPDKGCVKLFNNTVSMLSLGVGFKNHLTGYENIFLSGMLLGFDRKQISDKIDEIITFAELGEFINKPVRTYSSGMYSRLAFSITAMLETDIILIDETLSVGDAAFREKSYKKINELINDRERTVLIVSHDFESLRKLCEKTIWLDKGKIIKIANTSKIIEEYKKYFNLG